MPCTGGSALGEQNLHGKQQGSDFLSSLDLDDGAQTPLVPTPASAVNSLRLKSLTIMLCVVASSTLVDLVAVCPQLLELGCVSNYVDDEEFWPREYRRIRSVELLSFVGLACPHIRRLHYSIVQNNWSSGTLETLFKENSQVTEWSFLIDNLDLHLSSQLLRARNVITCLEIRDIRHRFYPLDRDLMETGLHGFLCNAPLFQELKAAWASYATDRLDPFSSDLLDGSREGSSAGIISAEEPHLWVCHDLETLELKFTQSTSRERPKRLAPRDVRIVFGDIGLDSAPMDLQSELCLMSRLQHLETLTIKMPGKPSRWSRGPDLSWLEPPSFLELSEVFQQRGMKKWDPSLHQEQELIKRWKVYFGQAKVLRQRLLDDSLGLRGNPSRAIDFAHSITLLGTLTDVRDCMDEIVRSQGDASRFTPRVVITGC